jgi:F-type H+-transporting ATPase subunit b
MRLDCFDCRASACETRRKLSAMIVGLLAVWALNRPPLAAQPRVEPRTTEPTVHAAIATATAGARASAQPAREEAAPAGREEQHESGGLVDLVARLVNFAILAGTLVYLLRSPISKYLADRGAAIRSDLVDAAEMKQTASAQIDEIDRKMKALPSELDALRAQGAQEIGAEEERIRAAAAAERERLPEQARREIDLQVKVAERELVAHAADLAVGVATERIRQTITDEDQKRLIDRYVNQLHKSES